MAEVNALCTSTDYAQTADGERLWCEPQLSGRTPGEKRWDYLDGKKRTRYAEPAAEVKLPGYVGMGLRDARDDFNKRTRYLSSDTIIQQSGTKVRYWTYDNSWVVIKQPARQCVEWQGRDDLDGRVPAHLELVSGPPGHT